MSTTDFWTPNKHMASRIFVNIQLSWTVPVSHHSDVIMGAMVSQITSLKVVCSTVYLGADQRKHQSSASLAFLRRIHRWPMNSPHTGPVTRKMFPFDDVIMTCFHEGHDGQHGFRVCLGSNQLTMHCLNHWLLDSIVPYDVNRQNELID